MGHPHRTTRPRPGSTTAPVSAETHVDRPATPFEQLLRRLAERGIAPDWQTNLPRYRHDDDIPWEIEAAAYEALEREDDHP